MWALSPSLSLSPAVFSRTQSTTASNSTESAAFGRTRVSLPLSSQRAIWCRFVQECPRYEQLLPIIVIYSMFFHGTYLYPYANTSYTYIYILIYIYIWLYLFMHVWLDMQIYIILLWRFTLCLCAEMHTACCTYSHIIVYIYICIIYVYIYIYMLLLYLACIWCIELDTYMTEYTYDAYVWLYISFFAYIYISHFFTLRI